MGYINRYVTQSKRGIFVAWNGASCDLDWIYRLLKRKSSKLLLPKRVKYFMDPYQGIRITTGCKLNKNRFHINLEFCSMYESDPSYSEEENLKDLKF